MPYSDKRLQSSSVVSRFLTRTSPYNLLTVLMIPGSFTLSPNLHAEKQLQDFEAQNVQSTKASAIGWSGFLGRLFDLSFAFDTGC